MRRCSVSLPTSLALQANHQFDKLMASHQTRAFGHPPPEGLLHPVFPWAEYARGGVGSGRGQPVAHAGLDQQVARLGRVALDLGPQLAHVEAQVMRELGELGPPHIGQQLPVRHNAARAAHQARQ